MLISLILLFDASNIFIFGDLLSGDKSLILFSEIYTVSNSDNPSNGEMLLTDCPEILNSDKV